MLTAFNFGSLFSEGIQIGIDSPNIFIAIVAVCVLWCVDLLQEKLSIRETLDKQNIIFRWVVIFAGLFAVLIFGIYGPGYDATNFIYEQF